MTIIARDRRRQRELETLRAEERERDLVAEGERSTPSPTTSFD
jgi:hypothetical protein